MSFKMGLDVSKQSCPQGLQPTKPQTSLLIHTDSAPLLFAFLNISKLASGEISMY